MRKHKKLCSYIVMFFLIFTISIGNFVEADAFAVELSLLGEACVAGLGSVALGVLAIGAAGYVGYKSYKSMQKYRIGEVIKIMTQAEIQKIRNMIAGATMGSSITISATDFKEMGGAKILGAMSSTIFLQSDKAKYHEDNDKTYLTDDKSGALFFVAQSVLNTSKNVENNIRNLVGLAGAGIEAHIQYSSHVGSYDSKSYWKSNKRGKKKMLYTSLNVVFLNQITGAEMQADYTLLWLDNKQINPIVAYYTPFTYTDRISTSFHNLCRFDSTVNGMPISKLSEVLGQNISVEMVANLLTLVGEGSISYSPPLVKSKDITLPEEITIPLTEDIPNVESEGFTAIPWGLNIPKVRELNPEIDTGIETGEITWTGDIVINPSIPDTGEGTATGEKTDLSIPDGGILDFSPLINALASIKTKFPFSIPWDILNTFKMLSHTPKVPSIFVDLKGLFPHLPDKGGLSFTFNLDNFSDIVILFRWFILSRFILGLSIKTRNIIRG